MATGDGFGELIPGGELWLYYEIELQMVLKIKKGR
jgi:hypothetical protein